MKEAKALFVPEEGNQPSLNQLAIVLGIPAVRLQSAQVAYKPIEGQPYSPKTINWPNVSAFIERRLDKTGYDSVEDVYAAALDVEYTPKKATRQKDPNSVYGKVLFGTTPMRKGHLAVGDTIHSKKLDKDFIVVYVDDTIVCYQDADAEDKLTLAIGNRMFNTNFDIPSAE